MDVKIDDMFTAVFGLIRSTKQFSNQRGSPAPSNDHQNINQSPRFLIQLTVLHLAAWLKCSSEVVKVLIEAGADINALDSRQRSPLRYASEWNPPVVLVLLEAGAKVNVLDETNSTPLYWAASDKHEASVVALMAASADPHLGESPLTSSDVSKEMKALIKSDVNYVEKTKEECKVM